jgi:hypothetical protein
MILSGHVCALCQNVQIFSTECAHSIELILPLEDLLHVILT